MAVSCANEDCNPGFKCGVMQSDTHCPTAICVAVDLDFVDNDKCPPQCPRGEECGKVEIHDDDVVFSRSICVSKDGSKLNRPEK